MHCVESKSRARITFAIFAATLMTLIYEHVRMHAAITAYLDGLSGCRVHSRVPHGAGI